MHIDWSIERLIFIIKLISQRILRVEGESCTEISHFYKRKLKHNATYGKTISILIFQRELSSQIQYISVKRAEREKVQNRRRRNGKEQSQRVGSRGLQS